MSLHGVGKQGPEIVNHGYRSNIREDVVGVVDLVLYNICTFSSVQLHGWCEICSFSERGTLELVLRVTSSWNSLIPRLWTNSYNVHQCPVGLQLQVFFLYSSIRLSKLRSDRFPLGAAAENSPSWLLVYCVVLLMWPGLYDRNLHSQQVQVTTFRILLFFFFYLKRSKLFKLESLINILYSPVDFSRTFCAAV